MNKMNEMNEMNTCNNGLCPIEKPIIDISNTNTAPQQPQTKLININIWKMNNKYLLKTYTASWCNPCQTIKPFILEFVKNFQHLNFNEIDKNLRPKHVKFIPWFDILDINNNEVIASIQTSNSYELQKFLNPYAVSY